MSRSIVLAVQVEASGVSVFEALTTQQGLASFWTPDVEAEPEVGAGLRFGFAAAPVPLEMTVLELDAGLLVTWECAGPWPFWEGTRVDWALERSDTTTVLLRHTGWDDDMGDAEFGSVAYTWALILGALKAYAETGTPATALT